MYKTSILSGLLGLALLAAPASAEGNPQIPALDAVSLCAGIYPEGPDRDGCVSAVALASAGATQPSTSTPESTQSNGGGGSSDAATLCMGLYQPGAERDGCVRAVENARK